MKAEILEYKKIPVDDLLLFDGNPRRGNIAAISESLRARGQYRPIVVNVGTHTGRPLEVLAGNHTLMAARSLGFETIDCGLIDVDDDTAKAVVASDNRLADLGDYDEKALADLLADLDSVEGTGYTDSDLDAILAAQAQPEELTDPDDAPSVPDAPITVPGDVYELGPHRVLCGDSTDAGTVVEKLLFDGLADCVWTDPPYGVSYVGRTKDSLTIENDGRDGLQSLLDGAFGTVLVACKPGAPVYVAHADVSRLIFESAFRDAGLIFRQNLVWVKNPMVLGRSDYHWKHEPIMLGHTPPADDAGDDVPAGDAPERVVDPAVPYEDRHEPLLYGFTPGGAGRLGRGGPRWYGDNKQTTIFEYPIPQRNSDHPTMKPVDLVLAMIKNSCPPRGVVLDLFGGSGSTLIAAHHRGAYARLVELDPKYVDVICRRWQQHTGVKPVRDGVEVDFCG